jgi:2-polyprenyl-3-methyl-5-hydroxy-6-metoxy-1,4-benzoquinol methylase
MTRKDSFHGGGSAGILGLCLRFLGLTLFERLGWGEDPRLPEDAEVTTDAQAVQQYGQIMGTSMAVLYGLGIDLIHRTRPQLNGNCALDLGCGPGLFTMALAWALNYKRVQGIDLSPVMIEAAADGARAAALADRLTFDVQDICDLGSIPDDRFDLVTCTNALQHMQEIGTVRSVISDMDRLAKPDGLVLIMDLGRLRRHWIADRYANLVGADIRRSLPKHFEDFQASLYGAWSPRELRAAVPRSEKRDWYHLLALGLPATQVVLGIPKGRKRLFVRPGLGIRGNPIFKRLYSSVRDNLGDAAARQQLALWIFALLSFSCARARALR